MAIDKSLFDILDEDDMASDSNTALSTQQSIKKYADDAGNKVIFLPLLQMGNDAGNVVAGDTRGISFADSVTDEAGSLWFVPDNFTSLTSIKFLWKSDVATGNAYFFFEASAVAEDEDTVVPGDQDSIAAAAYGHNGAHDLDFIDVTAMANGLTFGANHLISLRVERQAGNASDTINSSTTQIGFVLTYA